jgi:hypothetical protein
MLDAVTFRNIPDTGGKQAFSATIEPCQSRTGNVAG